MQFRYDYKTKVNLTLEESGFGGLVVSMLASRTFGGLVVSMLASDTFGGLVVSMLASGTQVCKFKPGRSRAFLQKGSKVVCPTSQICGMLKNPVITWKLCHRQNLSAISSLTNRGL
jgi:hypothetical protein